MLALTDWTPEKVFRSLKSLFAVAIIGQGSNSRWISGSEGESSSPEGILCGQIQSPTARFHKESVKKVVRVQYGAGGA